MISGFVLAIIEKAGMITTYHNIRAGTISAGYQNFILCIEMFFAAVMLRFAFPYTVYRIQQHSLTGRVALKTISTNLRKSINPRDIVQDTIHNFSPAYQHYAGVNISKTVEVSLDDDGRETVSYQVTLPETENHIEERKRDFAKNGTFKDGKTPLLIDTDDDDNLCLR